MAPFATVPELVVAAALAARATSGDRSTQIGCALFDATGKVVVAACNDLTPGVAYTPERCEQRPEKYSWYEHAERAALFACARDGVATKGLLAYTTGFPCADCARALVLSGVAAVYAPSLHFERSTESGKRWAAAHAAAAAILEAAGVEIIAVEPL
jgi:dCMP deaminase